uniref:Uncharacterized protein n=1 Tax=Cucumis sativus TaxID=3659 RepID=A0A0A0KCU4_CUCSA
MVEGQEIRKGPWTEQEDIQLICFVGLFGDRRWDFIAKVSGLNRTGKSCRLRWVNYLHPGLKRGKMTTQEERLVLELHAKWGNSKGISCRYRTSEKKIEENKEVGGDQNGYTMDDIWKDIEVSNHESLIMNQDVYSEDNNFSCPALNSAASSWEDYCCGDSLWKMEEEESKLIFSGWPCLGLAQPNQNFFY